MLDDSLLESESTDIVFITKNGDVTPDEIVEEVYCDYFGNIIVQGYMDQVEIPTGYGTGKSYYFPTDMQSEMRLIVINGQGDNLTETDEYAYLSTTETVSGFTYTDSTRTKLAIDTLCEFDQISIFREVSYNDGNEKDIRYHAPMCEVVIGGEFKLEAVGEDGSTTNIYNLAIYSPSSIRWYGFDLHTKERVYHLKTVFGSKSSQVVYFTSNGDNTGKIYAQGIIRTLKYDEENSYVSYSYDSDYDNRDLLAEITWTSDVDVEDVVQGIYSSIFGMDSFLFLVGNFNGTIYRESGPTASCKHVCILRDPYETSNVRFVYASVMNNKYGPKVRDRTIKDSVFRFTDEGQPKLILLYEDRFDVLKFDQKNNRVIKNEYNFTTLLPGQQVETVSLVQDDEESEHYLLHYKQGEDLSKCVAFDTENEEVYGPNPYCGQNDEKNQNIVKIFTRPAPMLYIENFPNNDDLATGDDLLIHSSQTYNTMYRFICDFGDENNNSVAWNSFPENSTWSDEITFDSYEMICELGGDFTNANAPDTFQMQIFSRMNDMSYIIPMYYYGSDGETANQIVTTTVPTVRTPSGAAIGKLTIVAGSVGIILWIFIVICFLLPCGSILYDDIREEVYIQVYKKVFPEEAAEREQILERTRNVVIRKLKRRKRDEKMKEGFHVMDDHEELVMERLQRYILEEEEKMRRRDQIHELKLRKKEWKNREYIYKRKKKIQEEEAEKKRKEEEEVAQMDWFGFHFDRRDGLEGEEEEERDPAETQTISVDGYDIGAVDSIRNNDGVNMTTTSSPVEELGDYEMKNLDDFKMVDLDEDMIEPQTPINQPLTKIKGKKESEVIHMNETSDEENEGGEEIAADDDGSRDSGKSVTSVNSIEMVDSSEGGMKIKIEDDDEQQQQQRKKEEKEEKKRNKVKKYKVELTEKEIQRAIKEVDSQETLIAFMVLLCLGVFFILAFVYSLEMLWNDRGLQNKYNDEFGEPILGDLKTVTLHYVYGENLEFVEMFQGTFISASAIQSFTLDQSVTSFRLVLPVRTNIQDGRSSLYMDKDQEKLNYGSETNTIDIEFGRSIETVSKLRLEFEWVKMEETKDSVWNKMSSDIQTTFPLFGDASEETFKYVLRFSRAAIIERNINLYKAPEGMERTIQITLSNTMQYKRYDDLNFMTVTILFVSLLGSTLALRIPITKLLSRINLVVRKKLHFESALSVTIVTIFWVLGLTQFILHMNGFWEFQNGWNLNILFTLVALYFMMFSMCWKADFCGSWRDIRCWSVLWCSDCFCEPLRVTFKYYLMVDCFCCYCCSFVVVLVYTIISSINLVVFWSMFLADVYGDGSEDLSDVGQNGSKAVTIVFFCFDTAALVLLLCLGCCWWGKRYRTVRKRWKITKLYKENWVVYYIRLVIGGLKKLNQIREEKVLGRNVDSPSEDDDNDESGESSNDDENDGKKRDRREFEINSETETETEDESNGGSESETDGESSD